MYELTYLNIEFLKKEVSKSGITFSHLQEDLIDHVCCDVEAEMNNGLPFEKAYESVILKIGIGGLQRIQEDTLYLIDKNYRTMKKTMKIFGVISPILLAFGALFKIEHWPTAGILLVLGFFFLSFFFLPSALYVSYKEISNKTRKWTYVFGFMGTFLLSIGFLSKVMHWPGASIVLVLGMAILCFVFLPSLVIYKIRESDSKVPKYVFVLAYIGFIFHLIGFTCKMNHWAGANILFLSGTILFVFIALPVYVYKRYQESSNAENSFIYIIFAIVWFVIPITLLSINISRNIFSANLETECVFLTDIQLIKEKNDLLIKEMPDIMQANKIKTDADSLVNYIHFIKAGMINIARGDHARKLINGNIEIALERVVELDKNGTCFEVLKNGKGNELRKIYKNLRGEILLVQNDKTLNEIISEIMPADPDEEIFNKHATTASSLNCLSFLQLNILRAENACLSGIAQQKTVAKLAGNNNKQLH